MTFLVAALTLVNASWAGVNCTLVGHKSMNRWDLAVHGNQITVYELEPDLLTVFQGQREFEGILEVAAVAADRKDCKSSKGILGNNRERLRRVLSRSKKRFSSLSSKVGEGALFFVDRSYKDIERMDQDSSLFAQSYYTVASKCPDAKSLAEEYLATSIAGSLMVSLPRIQIRSTDEFGIQIDSEISVERGDLALDAEFKRVRGLFRRELASRITKLNQPAIVLIDHFGGEPELARLIYDSCRAKP